MTERLEEKLIVASCYETERGAGGFGYCSEDRQLIAKKLEDAKLISIKSAIGEHNHWKFEFTDKGRQMYLDANGNIKSEYIISEIDH